MEPSTLATFGLATFHALLPLIPGMLTWVGVHLVGWLRARTSSTAANSTLDVLAVITETIVTDLEQTLAEQLRKSDGKLTADNAILLKQTAIDKVKAYYGPDGLAVVAKALKTNTSSVLSLIGSKIELAVYRLKYPGQAALPVFASGPATPLVKK